MVFREERATDAKLCSLCRKGRSLSVIVAAIASLALLVSEKYSVGAVAP